MTQKRSLSLLWICFSLALISFGAGCARIPTHPSALRYPELNVEYPKPERVVLDNGLVIYLLEDHEVPIVDGFLTVRGGSIYDPPEKIGLASMTGAVMRTGGTPDMTGDEIDEELELLAASVETSFSREEANASFSTMAKDLDRVLQLYADVILRPAFREDKIELKRREMLEEIRRRNDDPGRIASREFGFLVYGKENPWARMPSRSDVLSLTQQDLVEFHRRSFRPDQAILALAGDFSRNEMLEKIKKIFGDWKPSGEPFQKLEPIRDDAPRVGVHIVRRETEQVNIRLGHLGISRHDPDRFAVLLLNYILGDGGFNARLIQTIRSDLGLAYVVWGSIGHGTDRGAFTVVAETKSESTGLAVEKMIEIIQGMCNELVSEEDISRAKESLINQFVFLYDSSWGIVRQYASLEHYGYAEDYLDKYLDRLKAVTREDIQNAARKHLHPDSLVILAVGNPDTSETPLSKFGTVSEITLDAPEAQETP